MRSLYSALLFFFLLFFGCKPDEDINKVIFPGLPENVRYAKLSLSLYTNSGTLIANGKNSIGFFISFFDANKTLLTQTPPFSVKILVNGTSELSSPFKFSTTKPGTYTFSLKGFEESSLLQKEITVQAISDKELTPLNFPVIFHYIVPPNTITNAAQLSSLLNTNINQLNDAFKNINQSKDPNAVELGITFELAKTSPNGNLLEIPGLHIVENEKNKFENNGDQELNKIIWAGNFWSPKKYINVWICNFTNKYSYGSFPILTPSTSDFPNYSYGVFFKSDHFYSSPSQSILVHEVGHILNLFHTFNNSCDVDTDLCKDTKFYKRLESEEYTGGLQRTSCSSEKFIGVNYMDYWPNEYNTFTYDQRERAMVTLNQCPFLPTPKNNGSSGGRVRNLISSTSMEWRVIPEMGTY